MQRAEYNFVNSINAKETRQKYELCIKDFMRFLQVDNYDSLLKIDVEKSIINYIVDLRKKVSSSTLHTRLASIYHFYAMNDVLLNKNKIKKFKGEFLRAKKDRAYSHEEISKLLSNADLRMKVCILLMASSGLRLGALPLLKLKNIQDNKIAGVYEGTNQEYFTFVTPETTKLIDEYVDYRLRFGEKVRSESYLIRDLFNDFSPKTKGRQITKDTIREIIYHLLIKSGLNTGEVSMTHGFRKFFTTQLINSKVNPEIREMLLGHKIGLASCYYRPTEEEMYEEYEKAIDNLTIDPANRLQRKVETLQVEKSLIEDMALRLEALEKKNK
jgi:site-specific recombinase XerD